MPFNAREKHIGNIFNQKKYSPTSVVKLKKYIKKPNKWQSCSKQNSKDSATEITLRTL